MEAELFLCCSYTKMYRLYTGENLKEQDEVLCFCNGYVVVKGGTNVYVIRETTVYSSRLLYTHATQKQHFQKQVKSFQNSLGRADSKTA